ncbi:MAG: hypothetical protein WCJ97_07540 [Phycisphaerae bacterium]
MAQAFTHKDAWQVARTTAVCHTCGAVLNPGAELWATLVENLSTPEGLAAIANKDAQNGRFARLDICTACWNEGKRPAAPLELFSFWRSQVPQPDQKKKMFVEDHVLVELFTRLGDTPVPQDQAFRFMLALILLRKRLLRYEGMVLETQTDGRKVEVWNMILRGTDVPLKVANPQLDETQMRELSQQLSVVLAEEV